MLEQGKKDVKAKIGTSIHVISHSKQLKGLQKSFEISDEFFDVCSKNAGILLVEPYKIGLMKSNELNKVSRTWRFCFALHVRTDKRHTARTDIADETI